ncbi:MAG: 30S ribosomal protein S5 [Candidatus Peribacteraceae bacterium]|jgi:small subunit ribosomal protein S5|nr:30S ribosomal protein S5 [Candidatus Peribacteraceae bacterium]MDP7454121.1 30S ribosomal protein S5 [Candidatus Peribacteraceae bacterium]MDP7645983.1 30S ribosomal protein S5 [Candidatus Peribacteraceae bacterium]|tara:strand:- start:470 stop:1141 length:672 start_codon:yes stop_codon:yes gene_type:complete
MPKTSRPDRKRKDRSKREPKEFEETTLSVDRVTRVVKGGRRLRFRAVVVTGNKKGKVGLGTGKASEVQSAVQKAASTAKKNMIKIPIINGTIPHEVDHKFKAARIRIVPAREGTGIIAGGALRVILEHAGVQNVLSKQYGTSNKLVNAQATIKALKRLRGTAVDVDASSEEGKAKSAKEKKTIKDLDKEFAGAAQDREVLEEEGLGVTEVSKKDIDQEGNLVK